MSAKPRPKNRKPGKRECINEMMRRLKSRGSINSIELAQYLRCSVRTVGRYVKDLRQKLGIEIDYDASSRGYFLVNPNKANIPFLALEGSELFNALFAADVVAALLPAPLRQGFGQLRDTQLAAGVPGDVDLGKLNSLVIGTCGPVIASQDAMAKAVEGWRLGRKVRMEYRRANGKPVSYTVATHALFHSEDAWYLRARCVEASKELMSLALHRVLRCELLPETYAVNPQVAEDVRQGKGFNYPFVKDVKVVCPKSEEALYISERTWFGGCKPTVNTDGSVELVIPEVSESYILQWVLAFGGGVEIKEPAKLRAELAKCAQRMAKEHA